MAQLAKTVTRDNALCERHLDSDAWRFLKRTLQFYSSDSGNKDVFEKLQNLKNALDRQEATLLSWPDSPSKDRIRESLSKAKSLVTQIVDGLDGQQAARSPAPGIETS
jgi:hypothetical protein